MAGGKTYEGYCTTFRTLGIAGVAQNLLSIENYPIAAVPSPVIVEIVNVEVFLDSTVALAAFMCVAMLSIYTNVGGGTQLAKGTGDSNLTSAPNVVIRGGTAGDGGAATAITSAAPNTRLITRGLGRLHTAVGEVTRGIAPTNLVQAQPNEGLSNRTHLLRSGEARMVELLAGAAGSNPVTNMYWVNIHWREYVE